MSTNHPRSFPGIVVIALVGIAASALAAGFEPNDPYYFTNTPEGFPGQWHLNRQITGRWWMPIWLERGRWATPDRG